METVRDPSVRLRKDSVLCADAPISRECPLIERKRRGRRIDANLILFRTTRRGEILGAIGADIGLGGIVTLTSHGQNGREGSRAVPIMLRGGRKSPDAKV
jgi:hypothetical protein